MSSHAPISRPYVTLTLAFIAWKTIVLLVAASSPGVGYDTSTDVLLSGDLTTQSQAHQQTWWSLDSTFAPLVANKLTRWDAIYFVTSAKRGYLYEQEWAFGWGYIGLVKQCTKLLFSDASLEAYSAVAVLISNASHLLSVYMLYELCEEIRTEEQYGAKSVVVALLHIIAPAGIFLSAPYGESLFAAFTFAGCLAYSKSARKDPVSANLYLILAGLLFGISCTVRSNGIFSGLIFLSDLVQLIWACKHQGALFSQRTVIDAATVIVAGLLVAAGAAYPQYLAWTEYCGYANAANRRPWCESYLPSIYTFVQEHYWNVGFLRYWTLSNLPLFALATPMLVLMVVSALWAQTASRSQSRAAVSPTRLPGIKKGSVIRAMALPQLVLAVLSLTNFHVQIITRISSAYPVLYIWLASYLRNPAPSPSWTLAKPQLVIYWMVVYGLVQGALFAGFLPPA